MTDLDNFKTSMTKAYNSTSKALKESGLTIYYACVVALESLTVPVKSIIRTYRNRVEAKKLKREHKKAFEDFEGIDEYNT